MIATISLIVSGLALIISGLTAWLTLLRRGTVLMTRPSLIFFGPDGGHPKTDMPLKVYLRTMLYSTSKRGRIVENMYVRLRRGEASQNFNIWAYGEQKLSRGSGIFVPENGVESNHHFVLPEDGTTFQFLPGRYTLEVFASLVGTRAPRLLYITELEVTKDQAQSLKDRSHGLNFNWGVDTASYHPHLSETPGTTLGTVLSQRIKDSLQS